MILYVGNVIVINILWVMASISDIQSLWYPRVQLALMEMNCPPCLFFLLITSTEMTWKCPDFYQVINNDLTRQYLTIDSRQNKRHSTAVPQLTGKLAVPSRGLTYEVGQEYGQEHRDPYSTQCCAPPAAVLGRLLELKSTSWEGVSRKWPGRRRINRARCHCVTRGCRTEQWRRPCPCFE